MFEFSHLLDHMTSGPIIAMELMGSGVIREWRRLLGPTDSAEARQTDPNSIRSKFGKDGTANAAHGSDSEKSAKRVHNSLVNSQ